MPKVNPTTSLCATTIPFPCPIWFLPSALCCIPTLPFPICCFASCCLPHALFLMYCSTFCFLPYLPSYCLSIPWCAICQTQAACTTCSYVHCKLAASALDDPCSRVQQLFWRFITSNLPKSRQAADFTGQLQGYLPFLQANCSSPLPHNWPRSPHWPHPSLLTGKGGQTLPSSQIGGGGRATRWAASAARGREQPFWLLPFVPVAPLPPVSCAARL